MKKTLQSLVLGLSAYGCIENATPIREGEIQNNEPMTTVDNGICPELENGQHNLNVLVYDIIETIKTNTSQVSQTCLYDNNPNVDYLSDSYVRFWKDETGKHRVVITPRNISSELELTCKDPTTDFNETVELDLDLENVNIFPVRASFTSSDDSFGYTRYRYLKSNNLGIIENENNTCSLTHNPNIDTCHADNIVVSQKSDDFGTFWCVTVEGGFR